ncbi:MAG: twin-arginine translocase subunit TatC [Chloroflexi bacterium]|nr:twin-arginine translocase subunit TatC [Chloroflexota bacterium]
MTTNVPVEKKPQHSWHDYLGALGRAHRKASVELGPSLPLLQHLNELRQRLFKALAAVAVTTVISFIFAKQLINYLASPVGGSQALVSIEVTENIAVYMRVSLLSGLVLGMPFVLYQLMRFILPGLKGNERLWLLVGVPLASALFVMGVAFTWFVMIPNAVPFLTNFIGITTHVRPANYFDFITTLMFWIGLSFEMPIVMMMLAKLKFITAGQLARGWRYAVVIIAVIAAAITPTVDPINMSLVMAPLMGLYLVSVLLTAIAGR